MIRLAHDRFPKATILLNIILPRFDDEVLSHKGHIVNIHLAQLFKKLNYNVRFVDLSQHFQSLSLFAFDGLHINYDGNRRLGELIENEVTALLARTIPGLPPKPMKLFIPKELKLLTRKHRRKPPKSSSPSSPIISKADQAICSRRPVRKAIVYIFNLPFWTLNKTVPWWHMHCATFKVNIKPHCYFLKTIPTINVCIRVKETLHVIV